MLSKVPTGICVVHKVELSYSAVCIIRGKKDLVRATIGRSREEAVVFLLVRII